MKLAFIIGCQKYDEEEIGDLKYADIDANSFAKILTTNCGFEEKDIKLFSSGKNSNIAPTRSNIIRELLKDNYLKNKPGLIESIVFFFSGHGFHSSLYDCEYLVPQDAVFNSLEETSISIENLIKYLKKWNPRNIILFFDACRASIDSSKDICCQNFPDFNINKSFKGVAFFCSCSPGEKSYENDEIKGGIFTSSVCKALSDEIKCKTIYELDSYLREFVPQLCRKHKLPAQNPYTKVEPIEIKDAIIISENRYYEWSKSAIIGSEIRQFNVSTNEKINCSNHIIFALDFGTSYSTISVIDESSNVILVSSSYGESLIPSVVSFDENMNYVVGSKAQEKTIINPYNTIFYVKRYLGSKKVFNIGGRSLTPELVASLIIRSLKRNAEEFTGRTADEVVIAVPSNFSINQTNALIEACKLANLKVDILLREPIASSLALKLEGIGVKEEEDLFIPVIDLGGGTFDVSIVEAGWGGVYEEVATVGDNNLGGIDFENIVCEEIKARLEVWLKDKYPNYALKKSDLAKISFEAQRANTILSKKNDVSVLIRNIEIEGNFEDFETTISRDEFRVLTENLNKRIELYIKKALYLAKCTPSDINLVFLAGQGSKIFTVEEIIKNLFPSTPIYSKFQESAVVRGLCVQSGVLVGLIKDVLLLSATNRGIAIACMPNSEKVPINDLDYVEYIISQDEKENTSLRNILSTGRTVPTKVSLLIGIKRIEGDAVKLKLFEKSNSDEEYNYELKEIEVKLISSVIEIIVDIDAHRKTIFTVRDYSSGKEIEQCTLALYAI